MSVIPEISDMVQVIMNPTEQSAMPITENIHTQNDIKLDQNMKLKMDHNGFEEIESEFRSARDYVEVECTEEIAEQYGLDESRVGDPIEIPVDKESTPIPLASTSTSDDDLTEANEEMKQDQEDFIRTHNKNLPGKLRGKKADKDNYLTLSSHQWPGLEIPGDVQGEASSSSGS